VNLKPLDMVFNTTDEKFLKRLIEIIENNITNPGFRVETFVKEIGMSRAQLYRKMHALCGQSVKGFVRIVRLKQAALLLQHPTTTIAEVAYRVGFNNPAYFSECFRKQFGLLPSQYEDKAKH
jgi:AraC-like DNA-binding protein